MPKPHISADDWLRNVAERMRDEKKAGAALQAEQLTVRELLSKFGYARRGHLVVNEIRQILKKNFLHATPDFEFEYVDNPISIKLYDENETTGTEKKSISPVIRVDSLAAAHNNPVRVAPNDPIARATTIMQIEVSRSFPHDNRTRGQGSH